MKHTVEKLKLKGGSRLLIVDVPGSSGFLFDTYVRAGTKYAPKNKYEIAHLLEHLAFNGTKQLPSKMKFAYEVEKDGAYTNAMTADNTISYVYESAINEYERIVDIACGQLSSPIFTQADLDNEKEVITSELSRKLSNDRSRCEYNGLYLKVVTHAQTINKRIKSLSNITLQDVVNYHQKYHVLNNFVIVAAGDFSQGKKDKLIKQLDANLSTISCGTETAYKSTFNNKSSQTITVQQPKFKGQACMSFDLLQPKYDMSLNPALRVLRTMYGVGDFSRLFDKARAAGLSYGVSVGYGIDRDVSSFGFSDQTEAEKLLPLYELCLRELKDILDGNFTKQEFERAVGFIRGRVERNYDRAEDLGYYYENMFLDDDELVSPRELVEQINHLKPTDITNLNNTFFKKGSWILSLVGENIDKDVYRQVTAKYFG